MIKVRESSSVGWGMHAGKDIVEQLNDYEGWRGYGVRGS